MLWWGSTDVLPRRGGRTAAAVYLRIDFGEHGALGPGKVRLMELIGELGSISAGGRANGRSVHNISAGSVGTYVPSGGTVEHLRSAFAYFRSAFGCACSVEEAGLRGGALTQMRSLAATRASYHSNAIHFDVERPWPGWNMDEDARR